MKWALRVLLASALVSLSGCGRATQAGKHVAEYDSDDEVPNEPITVKIIHPKRDPSFRVSVQQLANVEAFFQADLEARASGVVKYVAKDIGESVRQGELLVEIDVPDLRQEVLQRESFVEQRRRELQLARTNIRFAKAAVEMAEATVQQRQAEVKQTAAARQYRQRRLARFKVLTKREAITPDVVDEQEQALQAAEAAEESALIAVTKAKADRDEKEASLEAAFADVQLKEAILMVAQKDLDRTRAIADYAVLTAPFDGVITRRDVDPGAFVQNATTGGGKSLLTVSRQDIVTVVVKLPENAAPFISQDTEVELQIDELPKANITGKVTRYSRAIDTRDRTMKVEVDLFNGTQADFYRLQGRILAAHLAPLPSLLANRPFAALAARACACNLTHRDQKGAADLLPQRSNVAAGQLLPGMTGYMRIFLDRFKDAYMLPASAVFSKGGKPYILVVRDGVTRLVPVKVQVNDGRLAKVNVMTRKSDGRGGNRDVVEELTGNEEVVASRQLETGDGQEVKATLEDW